MMTCQDLAARIEQCQPEADPREVARLCLLMTGTVDPLDQLEQKAVFDEAWRRSGLMLESITDQYTAVTEELEKLAESDSESFDMEQVWVLLRAIKVQSQILEVYAGYPALDV